MRVPVPKNLTQLRILIPKCVQMNIYYVYDYIGMNIIMCMNVIKDIRDY